MRQFARQATLQYLGCFRRSKYAHDRLGVYLPVFYVFHPVFLSIAIQLVLGLDRRGHRNWPVNAQCRNRGETPSLGAISGELICTAGTALIGYAEMLVSDIPPQGNAP